MGTTQKRGGSLWPEWGVTLLRNGGSLCSGIYKKNRQSGFGSTTGHPQRNTTTLEVYDLSGRKLYEKEILHAQNTLEITVSQWPRGVYNFILRFNKQTVASEKVVVQ